MTAYDTLGVSNDATAEEIKSAYKKLAQQHHPDRGGNKDIFLKIQEAYDALSTSERRQHYDATGEATMPPDQSLARIYNYLSAMMLQVIEQTDIDSVNLLEVMRLTIISNRNNNESEANKVRTRIKKRERTIARMVKKNGGDNILVSLMESDNKRQQAMLDGLITGVSDFNKMLTMLEDYVYNLPPAPISISQTSIFTHTTAT